jgi:hypothetical protein
MDPVLAIRAGAGGNEGIVVASTPDHDLHRGAGEGCARAEAHPCKWMGGRGRLEGLPWQHPVPIGRSFSRLI